jgi:hypothetical protein
MRLADDTRGRVPFALVGVLLLLGSTTYATTLATDGVRVDRDVEVAMDRATAASETALRVAVSRAARDAARTPVVDPDESGWGDTIDDSRPFRDSLRIRIYVAARTGFERAAYTHGDVTAAASLPATPTPGSLDRELDRVVVERAENGTALRVTLRNVSVVARQGERAVARETANRTVTVATPVLALHDRTVRFERALDRGPLEGPGLGRRLTARLYPVAWARGYAQWGGLPVSNVVGTRHVGISTNGAVLDLQKEAYGRSDPTGRAAQQLALARLAEQDLRAGVGSPATSVAESLVSGSSVIDPDDAPRHVPKLAPPDEPGPEREIRVGVNGTADRAFVSLHEGEAGRSLDEVLERAYRADLRLRTRAELVETEPWPHPRAPGPDASLVNETVDRAATVESGPAALPAREDGWTRFRTATRRVTVTHEITWTWVRDDETLTTAATVTERYRVGVAVDGRPARVNGTPERPVVPVFERGGALDGPNLADVPNESDAFLTERGGVDSIAARRATDGPDALDRSGSVTGSRPDGLRRWVSADLVGLQREVRNLSTVVRMDDAATGRSNPSARLASELAERRTALVDAPGRYDGAADRARVAARAAYLNRVHARLVSRENATRQANGRLVDRLRKKGIDLPGRASDVMANRTVEPADPHPVSGPLGGEDVFVPQGGPAYLDVQGVDGADAAWTPRSKTVYPLETRNLNVFTVPYGDAADAVVGSGGSDTVRLHTAALTLRAAENAGNASERLRARRAHLRTGIDSALGHVERRTRGVLAEETSLSPQERRQAVDAAFGRWNRTSTKALAVTNGSYVPAVIDASGVEGSRADRLGIHLRVAVAEARESPETGVLHRRVNGTASAVQRVSTTVATEAVGTIVANGTERLAKRAKGKAVILPAGLALLPTPTNWYVTVNVWEVRVRGEYPRFAVRTRRGAPGETVTYVRDGGVAEVDVDGDGEGEELGRAERVDFSVRTVILVAVPPGKIGVGDTNGQMIEESPGWNADDEK